MTQAGPAIPDICKACRLCCNGAMFGRVDLRDGEADPPARFGFDVAERWGHRCFTQPCRQLDANGCRAYAARPQACREYMCLSLRALERGRIDAAELARRTALARQAMAGLEALLKPDENQRGARERWIALARAPARSPDETEFLLRFAAFDRVLQRYFRKDDQALLRDADETSVPAMPD